MAKAGYKNLICFSGNRNGMDDETGMKNCVEAIEKDFAFGRKKWRHLNDGTVQQQN